MSAPEGGLTISGLTRRTGRTTNLQAVSLSVRPGQLTAVLGPPGSGKSALMEVLAGFSRASGAIVLDGREMSRLSARRRGFGVVQQHDALFPHMTLADNIAFPLRMRRVGRVMRARMTQEALDQLLLSQAGSKLPAQVSRAERQRAVLARATVFGPRLLLLDEPFSDQTPSERMDLAARLRRIHTLLGCVTLLATSEPGDALATADTVAVLQAGTVIQHGSAEDVFDAPRNAAVMALLGERNLLPGRIEALEDDLATIRLDCGPLVDARAGAGLLAGSACLVSLRPERIAIAPVAAAEMGDGAVDAVVVETRFLGEAVRLRLLIGSGAEIIVRRPAAAGLRGLSAGSQVAIAWQPYHAATFPP